MKRVLGNAHRHRTCVRKVKMSSYQVALAEARRLREKDPACRVTPYPCRYCGGWHNGTRPPARAPRLRFMGEWEPELGVRAAALLMNENVGARQVRRAHIAKHFRGAERRARIGRWAAA